MFEKVLIVAQVPFNEDQLVKKAKHLMDIGVKEVILAQCLSSLKEMEAMSIQFSTYLNENLEKQVMILENSGLTVQSRKIVAAEISSEIDKVALEEGCAMVVVGTESHNLISEFVTGGTAYDVIHKATVPVLVLKTDDSAEPLKNLSSHILFPNDFSENAALAFIKLKELAQGGIGKVTLMTVIKKTWLDPYVNRDVEEFKTKATDDLMVLKDELMELGVKDVEIVVLHGSPAQELLRYIDDKGVSMIVMGTQGRGFIKEVSLGSLSHSMVRHANAPVLLVPAERTEN